MKIFNLNKYTYLTSVEPLQVGDWIIRHYEGSAWLCQIHSMDGCKEGEYIFITDNSRPSRTTQPYGKIIGTNDKLLGECDGCRRQRLYPSKNSVWTCSCNKPEALPRFNKKFFKEQCNIIISSSYTSWIGTWRVEIFRPRYKSEEKVFLSPYNNEPVEGCFQPKIRIGNIQSYDTEANANTRGLEMAKKLITIDLDKSK